MARKLTDADWQMYERFGSWAWYCWACGAEPSKLDNAHIVNGQGREHDRRCIVRLCRLCHNAHHGDDKKRPILTTANLCWLKHNFDQDFYDTEYLRTLMVKRGLASQRHPLPEWYRQRFTEERFMDHVKAGAILRGIWRDENG